MSPGVEEDVLGLNVAVDDVKPVGVGYVSHEAVNPLQHVHLGRSKVIDG